MLLVPASYGRQQLLSWPSYVRSRSLGNQVIRSLFSRQAQQTEVTVDLMQRLRTDIQSVGLALR